MSYSIPAEFDALLESAIYVWCTTVRPGELPHTTPIWFLRDGDSFFFYTKPRSQKVKNLQENPHILLSYAGDEEGENYFVIHGEAHVDLSLPAPHLNSTYMTKYRNAPYMVTTTPEKYSTIFSLPIQVVPNRVHGSD